MKRFEVIILDVDPLDATQVMMVSTK